MTPMLVGISVMVLGIGLMFWHWSQWRTAVRGASSVRDIRYAENQFRRRVLIGSLMAIIGSLLMSLRWASDSRVFTATILLLLILLLGILLLAVLDLINVIVQLRMKPPSHEARARLVEELQRRQEREQDEERGG